jgi:hypothetical protein
MPVSILKIKFVLKYLKSFQVPKILLCFNSKIGIEKSIVLTYCGAKDFYYRQTREICHSIFQNEDGRLSQETISDWFSYLREASISALDTLYNQTGQIGGPSRTVEIDLTKFGKKKYNRGKRVEGS